MCHFSHILVTILITSIYKGEVTLSTDTSISKHGKISLKKSLILYISARGKLMLTEKAQFFHKCIDSK